MIDFNNSLYPLKPLTKSSILAITNSSSHTIFYAFPKDEIENINSVPYSLKLSVSSLSSVSVIKVGLLYKEDFINSRLKKQLIQRDVGLYKIDSNKSQSYTLSISIDPRNQPIYGFYLFAEEEVELKKAQISLPSEGMKLSENASFYGLQKDGETQSLNKGIIFNFSKIASYNQECINTESDIIISLNDYVQELKASKNQKVVSIKADSEIIYIKRARNQKKVTIPTLCLKNRGASLELLDNSNMITGVEYIYREKTLPENYSPCIADPGIILDWPQEKWRQKEFEFFSWEQYPEILFFDTENYKIQDQFFKRLAFFVEKEGYRGTIVSAERVKDLHGYNAHDYRAESLAQFFTEVEKTPFSLNQYELILRNILLKNGIIIQQNNIYVAGKGAIISISRESNKNLRNTFITHEGFHGMYFTHPEFRKKVSEVYNEMDVTSREFLEMYYSTQPTLLYDRNDRELMENETMAYLLQRSLSQVTHYFANNLAQWKSVNKEIPELAAYVRNTKGQGFYDAALLLNDYVFTQWGFSAGRVSLVTISAN